MKMLPDKEPAEKNSTIPTIFIITVQKETIRIEQSRIAISFPETQMPNQGIADGSNIDYPKHLKKLRTRSKSTSECHKKI